MMMPVLFTYQSERRRIMYLYPDCPTEVPFSILNEEWAMRNHSQTLKRLAERGGLSLSEICANIRRSDWEEITRDIRIQINFINRHLSANNEQK